MHLSIVTTMYYSAPYIDEFYSRICEAANKITEKYEIIFVNDGSPDNSLDIAVALYEKDSRVRVIDLSRNFGHHKAIMTGLSQATGDYVFLIDVDLEEEPEWLERFWKELINTDNIDIVYGIVEQRKGGWLERISGSLFFGIFNLLSDVKMAKNQTVVRLMTRRYLKSLLQFRESELVFAGLCELTGYNQKQLFVNKGYKGTSTYKFYRKVNLAIDYVASFSSRPLEAIFYLGLLVTVVSSIFAAKIIYIKIVHGIPVEGWASVMTSLWMIGGLLMFSIGTLGIYISKIFIEVKNRPYTIIRKIYEKKNEREGL